MYPSSASASASSSSQGSMGSSGGLMRYGSAPSSILSAAVDSVIGPTRELLALETQSRFGHSRFFASEANSESSQNDGGPRRNGSTREEANTAIGLQPSFGFSGGGGSSLFRHSSSPAGFLNQFAAASGDANGFSITRGLGSYSSKGMAETGGGISRLNSQHSFTGKESLSRISEETEDMTTGRNNTTDNNDNNNNSQRKPTHSYAATSGGAAAYGMGSWPEHNANSMMFSVAPPNRGKNNVVDALDNIESQFQFSISQTAQDMSSMEKLLNIPQDSITCKIRAKRGCATHPRSIAERERRTRISGKLKKLQDLVPNMDKQTSYADMLDLAVQHIKTLQNEVQKLNHDLASCSCGCKNTRDS